MGEEFKRVKLAPETEARLKAAGERFARCETCDKPLDNVARREQACRVPYGVTMFLCPACGLVDWGEDHFDRL